MISAKTLLRTTPRKESPKPTVKQSTRGKKPYARKAYKPDLPKEPLSGPVLYVATNLNSWIADEPKCWGRDVGINGTCYRRLDPMFYAWMRNQMVKAKDAKQARRISPVTFEQMRTRFNVIHEWAISKFGQGTLNAAWKKFLPRASMYKPPSMQWLIDLGFHGDDAEPEKEILKPWFLFPEAGEWPFHVRVSKDAVAKVRAIREEALSKGWSESQLFQNRGKSKIPFDSNYGLVCYLDRDDKIGKVTSEFIEIVTRPPWYNILRFRRS